MTFWGFLRIVLWTAVVVLSVLLFAVRIGPHGWPSFIFLVVGVLAVSRLLDAIGA